MHSGRYRDRQLDRYGHGEAGGSAQRAGAQKDLAEGLQGADRQGSSRGRHLSPQGGLCPRAQVGLPEKRRHSELSAIHLVWLFSPMTDLEEIVRELKPSCLIGAAAIPKVNYLQYLSRINYSIYINLMLLKIHI